MTVSAVARLIPCAHAIGPGGTIISGYSDTVRARSGRLSALSVPQRVPMKIHFVWGFCMGAQGA
jgi:hypothetical protein